MTGGASSPVTIAVDANGADLGPTEVALGAAEAAAQGVRVLLFGPAREMGPVPRHGGHGRDSAAASPPCGVSAAIGRVRLPVPSGGSRADNPGAR